jgi:hypothetical protein
MRPFCWSARIRRDENKKTSDEISTASGFREEYFDSATPKGSRASAGANAPAKAPLPSHQGQEAGSWAEAQTTPNARSQKDCRQATRSVETVEKSLCHNSRFGYLFRGAETRDSPGSATALQARAAEVQELRAAGLTFRIVACQLGMKLSSVCEAAGMTAKDGRSLRAAESEVRAATVGKPGGGSGKPRGHECSTDFLGSGFSAKGRSPTKVYEEDQNIRFGTGRAAHVEKIRQIKQAPGDFPLGTCQGSYALRCKDLSWTDAAGSFRWHQSQL